MLIAKSNSGWTICAHCGKVTDELTKDHFMPKSCRMTVNEEGNYVGLCKTCNQEKADQIVLPSWYGYLNEEQQFRLNRYMRYCRSHIRDRCTDPVILDYIEDL